MDPYKLSKQEFEVNTVMEYYYDETNIHYFQLMSPALASQADGLGANTEASPRTSVGLKKSISLGGLTPPLPSLSLPSLTYCLLLVKEEHGGLSEGDVPDGGGPHPVLGRHHNPPGGKQGQTLYLLILVEQAELSLGTIRLGLVTLGQDLDNGLEQDRVVGGGVGNSANMRAKTMNTCSGHLEGSPGLVTEEVLADNPAKGPAKTKEDEMKSWEPLF